MPLYVQAHPLTLLDSAVDDSYMKVAMGRTDVEGRFGADLLHQIDLFRIYEGFVLIGIILFSNGDSCQRRTLLAQVGNNSPRINAGDSRHTLSSTPLTQALNRCPMAVLFRDIRYNYSASL